MKPLVKNFRKFLNDLINYKEDDYYEDYQSKTKANHKGRA